MVVEIIPAVIFGTCVLPFAVMALIIVTSALFSIRDTLEARA
jgi:hypothetical protein